MGAHPTTIHVTGVYLTGVYLMGVYLINVHLTGMHLMGMHLIGVYLMGQNSVQATADSLPILGSLPMRESSVRRWLLDENFDFPN